MRKVLVAVALASVVLVGCSESEAERKADKDCQEFAKALRVAGMVDDAGDAYMGCYPERLKFYMEQEDG